MAAEQDPHAPKPRVGLDHVMLRSKQYDAAAKFYTTTLAALGYKPWPPEPGVTEPMLGLEINGHPDFWIAPAKEGTPDGPSTHLAFSATKRTQVREWYDAAIKAGGKCNGGPGLRPYHPDYYAAFVIDLDGNNIEACCHLPEAVAGA